MPWPTASRQSRGYGRPWELLRERVIARDQCLCQQCKREDRYTEGREVDHIVPKAKGGTDAIENLQLLCVRCHIVKGYRDKGIDPKQQVGVDGWPVDG